MLFDIREIKSIKKPLHLQRGFDLVKHEPYMNNEMSSSLKKINQTKNKIGNKIGKENLIT